MTRREWQVSEQYLSRPLAQRLEDSRKRRVQFLSEYMGAFITRPNASRLDELAREYVERTEGYDRTVCDAIVDGVAMPTTGEQRRRIEAHALLVYNELSRAAVMLGYTVSEFREAIARQRDQ